jgi:hypothetical protein
VIELMFDFGKKIILTTQMRGGGVVADVPESAPQLLQRSPTQLAP